MNKYCSNYSKYILKVLQITNKINTTLEKIIFLFSTNVNNSKLSLVPISSGSRVGSGKLQSQVQQQQQQQQQQIRGGPQHYQLGKKRFSSIEVVSSSNQQQQQQQPTSTSAVGLTKTTSLSS